MKRNLPDHLDEDLLFLYSENDILYFTEARENRENFLKELYMYASKAVFDGESYLQDSMA